LERRQPGAIFVARDNCEHGIEKGKARPAARHFEIGQLEQGGIIGGLGARGFRLFGPGTKVGEAIVGKLEVTKMSAAAAVGRICGDA
jgi:hypothetical protein